MDEAPAGALMGLEFLGEIRWLNAALPFIKDPPSSIGLPDGRLRAIARLGISLAFLSLLFGRFL